MYDLSFFRQNLDAIASRLADRGFTLDVEAFRKLDAERRELITEAEQQRAEQKRKSQDIPILKKRGRIPENCKKSCGRWAITRSSVRRKQGKSTSVTARY